MKEFTITAQGTDHLHCAEWTPEGTPVGVVQLVHGIAEHIARYDGFARFLNSKGYVVVAEDHMGHGKTLRPGEPMGYFHGGWLTAVEDTYTLTQNTMAKYPGLPYFIFGHSMGSFLTRTLLFRHPDSGIRGALLCGSGWQPSMLIGTGQVLASLACHLGDEKKPCPLLHAIMFSGYNKRCKDSKSPFAWLSVDPENVARYEADPLCGFVESVGLDRELLRGLAMNQDPKNLRNMRSDLPVLFLSGGEDPVGHYGKDLSILTAAFRKAGLRDVAFSLYKESRHEILHDIEQENIHQDVAKWLDNHR